MADNKIDNEQELEEAKPLSLFDEKMNHSKKELWKSRVIRNPYQKIYLDPKSFFCIKLWKNQSKKFEKGF